MIHIQTLVSDTAILLGSDAYGPGALLRWESGATEAGAYVEGGTVALVSGTAVYDVWDSAGTDATWYRTRISDAGATTFSPYADPFQAASQGMYLSLSQARSFVPTNLTDEALLSLLDDVRRQIDSTVGPRGNVTEWLAAQGPLLMLSRQADSIVSVTNDWNAVLLDPTDYELSGSGMTLRRLRTGPNPGYGWGRVTVVYSTADAADRRTSAAVELLKLEVAYSGFNSQSTQSESRSFGDLQAQRQEILGGLVNDTAPALL
jgi:hypothetical protein